MLAELDKVDERREDGARPLRFGCIDILRGKVVEASGVGETLSEAYHDKLNCTGKMLLTGGRASNYARGLGYKGPATIVILVIRIMRSSYLVLHRVQRGVNTGLQS